MRILIVEDDIVSRALLARLLSSYGQCDIASNGREAMELLTKGLDSGTPYHLVCLDIMMPFMNGLEVLRELRNEESTRKISGGKAAKVIMTTALSEGKNLQEAFDAGCGAYLVKPIVHDDLLRILSELGIRR
ncbi:MAG: response regulator [Bdellovibrionota bacterium]|nr:MAG: response regulator [Bdellovibrionota bacterium]